MFVFSSLFLLFSKKKIFKDCLHVILSFKFLNFTFIYFPLGGAVHTDNRASGHSLAWTKALISKPAPHWEGTAVINGEMKELKLSDFKGKYLVFFFYPLDFTFVCPTEILAFNDRVAEFRAIGAEVTKDRTKS